MNRSFYFKTTETCNLNCKHCFTSGTQGPKVYWNPEKVVDWFKRFRAATNADDTAHVDFHGGEPFLVDVSEMHYVYDECKNLWSDLSWGVTTNLVYKLTPEIIDFMKGPLNGVVATSWDANIRFANPKQYDLWRKNLRTLQEAGIDVKLFISVTTGTLAMEPIDLLEWVRDLGVKNMSLERLTHNGNAKLHPDIFPVNTEQDAWFLKMHRQSEAAGARSWFENEFLESVYSKFDSNFLKGGTFCRDCEQKLFTVNADGTIAGCPNSAPEQHFGHIDDDIEVLFNSSQRLENIACETARNPACFTCDVFDKCGGDCHQLSWQGDVCGAPKSLMRSLKSPRKVFLMKAA